MAIYSIKKRVASRLASSKTLPAALQRWAKSHADLAPAATTHTTDLTASPDTTPESNTTPEVGATIESSSSTLPFLELAFEATKINTRSCLKKPQHRPPGYYGRRPAKRVAFVYDDVLLTCTSTGLHLIPEVKTAETQQRFLQRSEHMSGERAAEKKARRLARVAAGIERAEDSSDDEDDDETRNHGEEEEKEEEEDMSCMDDEEKALNEQLKVAERSSEALTIHTIACGGLDFALYVARMEAIRESLEQTARFYKDTAKVASYRGEERRYAFCGATAQTELEQELYDDYRTSMSGCRPPKAVRKVGSAVRIEIKGIDDMARAAEADAEPNAETVEIKMDADIATKADAGN